MPAHTLLASGSDDRTVKLWNSSTGQLLRTFTGHSHYVESVAFDSGHLLASGSRDRTIKVWNTTSGHLVRTLVGHGDFVNSVAFGVGHDLLAGRER